MPRSETRMFLMAPAWMLLIERIKNADVIVASAWMLFIERIKNADVLWLRHEGLSSKTKGFRIVQTWLFCGN